MTRVALVPALLLSLVLAAAGCAESDAADRMGASPATETSSAAQESVAPDVDDQAEAPPDDLDDEEKVGDRSEETREMKVSIGGTDVNVEWEDNQAVAELRALATGGPVTVGLSRYGGFEQVGPIGTSLTTSDAQMTTEPGDIVLYAGNQISVFYVSGNYPAY